MSAEVRYAIPGEPHDRLPWGESDLSTGPFYQVIPWNCPQCEQLVAEMVVDEDVLGEPQTRTVLVSGPPVRLERFERDGIPFHGPGRRAMRGKSPRRKLARLSLKSAWRAELLRESGVKAPDADYEPIVAAVFDTVCDNCPLRVRVGINPPA